MSKDTTEEPSPFRAGSVRKHHKFIIIFIALAPMLSYLDVLVFYSGVDIIHAFGRFLFYSIIETVMFSFGMLTGYASAKTEDLKSKKEGKT
jgi:hypothetical protein